MPDDQVRYTTVGALRSRGFTVEHTPERAFPQHVSVSLSNNPDKWHAEGKRAFEAAFVAYAEGSGREV